MKRVLSPLIVAVTASFAVAAATSTDSTTLTTTTTTTSISSTSTTTAKVLEENAIEITTLWNGTLLENESDRVILRFTKSEQDELQIEFDAAFYNSPIPSEPMIESCPERPFNGLYNYEVVEVFFLNDDDQYLEVEVSPRGRYLLLLLDGERNTLLQALPVFPDGVTELDNPCLDQADGCDQRWSGKLTIPQEYMPPNVNRMNAYAIRGGDYGTPFVDDGSKIYLAYYGNTESESPDFHHLDSFGEVPEAVTADGYAFPTSFSDIWETARGDEQYSLRYEVEHPADCEHYTASDEYSCGVSMTRDDLHGVLRVVINVTDSELVAPVIKDDLMTQDSESVWLTFSNGDQNELRIGVNPAGDSIVQFVHDGDEWIDSDVDITDEMAVRCQYPAIEGGPADYRCVVNIHTDLLPANVTYFQILHIHRPLKNAPNSGIDIDLGDYEFIGAVCPGNPEGNGYFDFRGCGTDNKMYVDPMVNWNYSMIWEDALSAGCVLKVSSTMLAMLSLIYLFEIF